MIKSTLVITKLALVFSMALFSSFIQAGDLDKMTISEYAKLSLTEKVKIDQLVQQAAELALRENFKLYMVYDQSAETLRTSISTNMLNNAVIWLTHKRGYPNEFSYIRESTEYYKNNYGEDGKWKEILEYLNANVLSLLKQVVDYLAQEDSAFPSTALLIPSISHAARRGLASKL